MHPERHLSLEAYENFSSRRQSTFASHRSATADCVGYIPLTVHFPITGTGSTTFSPHSGGRRRRKVMWTLLTGECFVLFALVLLLTAYNSTHAILECLQTDVRIIGQPVDFLYVDEAQDNLLIDALSTTMNTDRMQKLMSTLTQCYAPSAAILMACSGPAIPHKQSLWAAHSGSMTLGHSSIASTRGPLRMPPPSSPRSRQHCSNSSSTTARTVAS